MAEALNPCLHGYLSSFLLGLVRVVYDNTQYLQNYWQFRRTHLFSNWYSRKTSDSDTRFYVHSKGREVSSNDWLMVHSRGGVLISQQLSVHMLSADVDSCVPLQMGRAQVNWKEAQKLHQATLTGPPPNAHIRKTHFTNCNAHWESDRCGWGKTMLMKGIWLKFWNWQIAKLI